MRDKSESNNITMQTQLSTIDIFIILFTKQNFKSNQFLRV